MIFSFSAKFRLQASEFRQIFENGKRFYSPNLALVILTGQEPDKKIGISLSRKVGNAVVRNKLKRWIREAYRHNQQQFQGGFQVVVRVKEKHRLNQYQEVEKEFLELMNKALPAIKD